MNLCVNNLYLSNFTFVPCFMLAIFVRVYPHYSDFQSVLVQTIPPEALGRFQWNLIHKINLPPPIVLFCPLSFPFFLVIYFTCHAISYINHRDCACASRGNSLRFMWRYYNQTSICIIFQLFRKHLFNIFWPKVGQVRRI